MTQSGRHVRAATSQRRSLLPDQPTDADQILLEEQSCALQAQEWEASQQKIRSRKQESLTKAGRTLVARLIPPFAKAIEDFGEQVKTRPSRLGLAMNLLSLVDAKVLAYIATQGIINEIGNYRTIQSTALALGRRVQDEITFQEFDLAAPRLFKKVTDNLSKHPKGYQESVRRSMLKHTMRKNKIEHRSWGNAELLRVGLTLIELFSKSTGAVEIVAERRRRGYVYRVVATQEIVAWIDEYDRQSKLLAAREAWMIVKPEPHAPGVIGGYKTRRLKKPLVISKRRGYNREFAAREMPAVYKAVNALQDSPFRIDTELLAIFEKVWEAGLVVGDIPQKYDNPMPVEPVFNPANKQPWVDWKKKSGELFIQNLKWRSQRTATLNMLATARQFSKYEAIYAPVRLDTRGRAYYVPRHINPQGGDLSRSLLRAARGKPLGERGLWWLKTQLANCFGIDKVSYSDRHKWVEENSARIVSIAADPLGDLWWTEADSPWQFLAACLDWAGYTREGLSYVCSLLVSADATCSGIQHLSAMSRDPVAGSMVNLTPSDKPQDIYGAVALKAIELLKEDQACSISLPSPSAHSISSAVSFAECRKSSTKNAPQTPVFGFSSSASSSGQASSLIGNLSECPFSSLPFLPLSLDAPSSSPAGSTASAKSRKTKLGKAGAIPEGSEKPKPTAAEIAVWAGFWLQYGVTRKTTKRQVMVFPYGGTFQSCMEYTRQAVEEHYAKLGKKWDNEASIPYLAGIIWKAINLTITGPNDTMKYIRSLVVVAAKQDVPLTYTIEATGFVVQQAYECRKRREVKTKIGEKLYTLQCDDTVLKIDKRKQGQASGPNVVHAYDGAQMALTTNASLDRGVETQAMVHDCYETIPADMDIVREESANQFVYIYTTYDVLADFRRDMAAIAKEDAEMPPIPVRGNLDIGLVKISPYFFS